jgi:DNA topoisomerase-3
MELSTPSPTGLYLEGSRYIVAWARGHLVTPKSPDAYGDQWKKWDLNTLPIIPEKFQYEVIRATSDLLNGRI